MKKFKKLSAFVLSCAMATTSLTGLAVPTDVYAASKTASVSTQKQLDKALADKKIKTITIKSKAKKKFVIKKGSYTAKTLKMNGARIVVKNSGSFKNILISDVASFEENAKGNQIKVLDKKISVVIGKQAVVNQLDFAKTGARDTLKVNGKVKAVKLSKKTDLNISGTSKSKIPVNITANGSKLTSSVGVAVDAAADVQLKLEKGAEASNIQLTKKDAKVDVKNNTAADLKVKKFDNTTEIVDKGSSLSIQDSSEKKEDDKKEDEKKEDEKNQTENTGNTGFVGNITSDPGSSVPAKTDAQLFAEKIGAATEEAPVSLEKSITGNVDAAFNGTVLTLNLNNYSINGQLKLTAPNATQIDINDSGKDFAGATIQSLVIDAPNATVNNNAKVTAGITIKAVKSESFHVKDNVSGDLKMQGPGRVEVEDIPVKPAVVIDTTEDVILAGKVEKVSVEKANKIQVEDEVAISNFEIKSTAQTGESNVKLEGQGRVENLVAAAPVVVDVQVEELKAQAPVEVKKTVGTVVVESNEATLTVDADVSVSTVSVGNEVTTVEIKGTGTVATIDASAATSGENASEITIKSDNARVNTIVADGEKVSKEGTSAQAATVKSVTGITVNTTSAFRSSYYVGEDFSIKGLSLTVNYSGESETSEIVNVSAIMVDASQINKNQAGTYAVVLNYAGKTATLTNIVYSNDEVASIEALVAEDSCNYMVGDTFPGVDKVSVTYMSGKVEYKDNAVSTLPNDVYNGTFIKKGQHEVTVTYAGKQDIYTINVLEQDKLTYTIPSDVKTHTVKNGGGKEFTVLELYAEKISSWDQFRTLLNIESSNTLPIEYEVYDRTGYGSKLENFPTVPGYYSLIAYSVSEDNSFILEDDICIWFDIMPEKVTFTKNPTDNNDNYECLRSEDGSAYIMNIKNNDYVLNVEELKNLYGPQTESGAEVKTCYYGSGSDNPVEGVPTEYGAYVICFYAGVNNTSGQCADLIVRYINAPTSQFTFEKLGQSKYSYKDEMLVKVNGDGKSFRFLDMNGTEISGDNMIFFDNNQNQLDGEPTANGDYFIQLHLDRIEKDGVVYVEAIAWLRLFVRDNLSDVSFSYTDDRITLTGTDVSNDKFSYDAANRVFVVSGTGILTKEEMMDTIKPVSESGDSTFNTSYYYWGSPVPAQEGFPDDAGFYSVEIYTTDRKNAQTVRIQLRDFRNTSFKVATTGAVTFVYDNGQPVLTIKKDQGSYTLQDEYERTVDNKNIYYYSVEGETPSQTVPEGASEYFVQFFVDGGTDTSTGQPTYAIWHRIKVVIED